MVTTAQRTTPMPSLTVPAPGIIVAIGFLVAMVALAAFGPRLLAADPDAISLPNRLTAPIGFGGTWDHPLGTDQLGRDVLARVLAGTRISLAIALSATLVAGTIGTSIGLLGGFFRGRIDTLTLWLADVQMAIPFIVVAIGIGAVFNPSAFNVVLILGATSWATYARVARLATKPLRSAAFVDAARVAGSPRCV